MASDWAKRKAEEIVSKWDTVEVNVSGENIDPMVFDIAAALDAARDEALEEAAKVADEAFRGKPTNHYYNSGHWEYDEDIAAAIRERKGAK